MDDLLRMRSGIADSWDKEFVEEYYDHPLEDMIAEDLIKSAAAKADQLEPSDQETKYTNVNYNILGGIIKKETGNDTGTQITKSIFKRLGMENTIYPTNAELHLGNPW